MKHILATGAALAMLCAQPVFAQSATSETTVSRSVDANGVAVKRTDKSVDSDGATVERSRSIKATPEGETQVKRSEKVTDGQGGEMERSRTYTTDGAEKKVTTTSRKKTPNGAEQSSHTESTVTPN